MRLARDLDIAEEATADAFVLALQTWPERGVPESVEAWLLTAPGAARSTRSAGWSASVSGPPSRWPPVRASAADDDAADQWSPTTSCGSSCCAAIPRSPRGAGRADAATRLRRADGGDRQRVPRLDADDGGPAHPGQAAIADRRHRHRPARRHRGRRAPAGRPSRGPPGLHAGPHRRRGRRSPRRRSRRPRVRLARTLHELRPDDRETAGLLALLLLSEARAATRLDGGGQVLLAEADRSSGTAADRGGPAPARARAAGARRRERSRCRPRSRPSSPGRHVRGDRWDRVVDLYARCCSSSRARRSPSADASRSRTCSARPPASPTSTR